MYTSEAKTDTVEALVNDIIRFINLDNYCYFIEATEQSFTSGLYEINTSGAKYKNETVTVFNKFTERIEELLHGKGILLICVGSGEGPTFKFISHYNRSLFTNDVFELILFQEYGVEPCDEERKQVLKKSIKEEKIKDTLLYACYENNTNKILECLKNTKQSQLNKKFEYTGTPLGLCAKNNNLVGFKAIAEAGAAIGKISLADTPLSIAFTHSASIVKYIYTNFREQFDKEVNKKGFGIAIHTKDTELLQLLFDCGCNINCSGKPFPPLHNFADYNNSVGLKFLLEHGADINTKNQYKQTALDRSKRSNKQEAIELLRLYGAAEE
jgi:hypothetical protein